MLPSMKYGSGIRKWQTIQFGGLDRSRPDKDGRIWEMRNLCSDQYPLISARGRRHYSQIFRLEKPNGIFGRDGLYYVDGTTFYANGTQKGTVQNGQKSFAAMGTKIILFPDKKYFDTADNQLHDLQKEIRINCIIDNGTIYGEDAAANTIICRGGAWKDTGFKVGDALTISGASMHPENNKTVIVREMEGEYLRFYENTFTIGQSGDEEPSLTLKRAVPDLDFVFENENRLWGCKGSTIYCSKLGDPTNWNVFDGLSTDSWTAEVGSGGSFTGACSYLGYPMFFKEDQIYKVYGEKVSAYQVMNTASMGVEKGSGQSLAIAGETLIYLSRTGFVAYTGGVPKNIHWPFGERRFKNAVAGSDGVKYYVSAQTDGGYELWVYDTRYGAWHREDETQAAGFAWDSQLYCLDADGTIWLNADARTVPEGATMEEPVEAMVEFGDFTGSGGGQPNKKGTGKLQLRAELGEGAAIRVEMRFDGGEWMQVASIQNSAGKRSYYLPLIPRRSDHYRIRISGTGEWTLNSLVREEYTGSER